ncbi:MAG: DHH family phosphoesterase [Candidatus Pacearchaeota archaeon]|jgi:single-stranded DNA-specific DHH superfamily exonuclease
MLTETQISEIREHLEKAQNPLFFFDNDNDGLMSFLLLRRFIERGRGIAVKGSHNLSKTYHKRVEELKPDYIFILDIPVAEKDFLEMVETDGLPVVWIDHHDVSYKETNIPLTSQPSLISYYNPFHNNKTNEPVSYLCYKITNKKEDLWLAVIGSISDYYMPDFYNEFEKKYPELSKKNPKTPFDVFYDSEIGRIARILDFSLKDTTTNVVSLMKFMMKVKGPMDVLEENTSTKQILKRSSELNEKYQRILKKARKSIGDKMIYFQYSGDLSLSANLANQLSHEFPKKIIIVAYLSTDIANLSLRARDIDIRKITLEAIKNIPGAVGGGHEHATGARMNVSDLPLFKKRVDELVG